MTEAAPLGRRHHHHHPSPTLRSPTPTAPILNRPSSIHASHSSPPGGSPIAREHPRGKEIEYLMT
ncbi:hypothetical protein E2C01_037947 [Portunus trituberculatus]|uniref:Uncharacterized protein n=1 Tax=Portunus trituberculatus TaxID=210409 RepID=A0A5B7FFH0_PORTR|nr:hypothetical protein [Portunus trituberculatus]